MKAAKLKLQMWGNSLAVRIPSEVARAARLSVGQPVEVSVQEFGLAIMPAGPRELTLSERLQAYDVQRHGGEVMAARPVGKETL